MSWCAKLQINSRFIIICLPSFPSLLQWNISSEAFSVWMSFTVFSSLLLLIYLSLFSFHFSLNLNFFSLSLFLSFYLSLNFSVSLFLSLTSFPWLNPCFLQTSQPFRAIPGSIPQASRPLSHYEYLNNFLPNSSLLWRLQALFCLYIIELLLFRVDLLKIFIMSACHVSYRSIKE